MDQGLYNAVMGMMAADRRLQVSADNLANIGTAAYKRRESFSEALRRPLDDGQHRNMRVRSRVDFSQGDLRATGNPYDLALSGPGFFAVESPQGQVYTRNGAFAMTAEGMLQTPDGYPVAWDHLNRAIDPTGDQVLIGPDGRVEQEGVEIGVLEVVDFENPQGLELDGRGYWHAPRGLRRTAPAGVVRQGTIEDANVRTMEELVELIVLQRSYESSSNVVRSLDRSYQRLYRQQG